MKISDFSEEENAVLIMQDGVAGGRSCTEVLNRFLGYIEECKTTMSRLYGFLASPGLKLIEDMAKRNNIEVRAFSIGNVADLE